MNEDELKEYIRKTEEWQSKNFKKALERMNDKVFDELTKI